ncbi:MAG: Ig-like domain-containing protein [Anaerolineales bacterium]|nr:Ig-like domain-containing protein [Anaerolineales bacterium]
MTIKWMAAICLAIALAGCNMPVSTDEPPRGLPELTDVAPVAGSGPRSWIDRPLEGSQFALGRLIPIRWHTTDSSGVQQVEIRINGEILLVSKEFDHTSQLANQEAEWNPTEAGEYLIEVLSTGVDGSQGPVASKRITILAEGGVVEGAVYSDLNQDGDADDEGEGPLEAVSVILVECTEKLSLVTAADGAFRFEGLPFGTDCVMDFSKTGWRTVGTFPAEIDLPIHFSPSLDPIRFSVFMTPDATPTPTATASLTPRPFIPTVPPVVVTPTIPTKPAPDTQPPPIPIVVSPRGSQILGCLDSIVLRWKAVTDASGIDVYQVELYESHDNGDSWDGAGSWSLDQFTQLDVSSQTDCGLLYQWKVRARDNAGNTGGWGMTTFGIGID